MRSHLAVLRTYVQRPSFRWLAAVCLFWPLADAANRLRWTLGIPLLQSPLLFDILRATTQVCLPIALGVTWTAHLREQLSAERARLVPGSAAVHLRVARWMLAVLIVVVPASQLVAAFAGRPWVYVDPIGGFHRVYPALSEYAGGLMVSAALVVSAAFTATFGSPWASLMLAPAAFIAMVASDQAPWEGYRQFAEQLSRSFLDLGGLGATFPMFWVFSIGWMLTPLVIVACLRPLLWRRIGNLVEARRDRRPQADRTPRKAMVHQRRLAGSTWARVRQRRSPVLGGFAPCFAGLLVMCALFASHPMIWDDPATQLRISMILVTILPAVAVGCIWADRWPRVAVESLLPATRRQFVTETTLAVGVDLATFWAAIAIGVTVPLVLFPAKVTDWHTLLPLLGASALVQAAAFAAVLWGLVLRSWPGFATLLGIALVTMVGPLLFESKRVELVPVQVSAPTIAAMLVVGCVMMWMACRRLARGDLA